MANSSGSRHELKKIKKIKSKSYKKCSYSSIDSSISDSDSYYSLSSYSQWYKRRQPTEHKEINKLDIVVSDNINKMEINIMTP